ncbi:MAG TPA: CBS domain-containing protein [Chryseolinea sp.]|nr:CBS domain-containing protein [Chryseolinea sp.]
MAKVKHILQTKGNAIFAVEPSITVYEAIEVMCEKNIGGLLIVDESRLVGIFTERDYARKIILKGKSSKETPIGDIMTSNLITVNSETSIEECMQVMVSCKIRHLPVVDDGELSGIISIGDVVRSVIDEQKVIIHQLETYITGQA